MTEQQSVAFLGLGAMGSRMASRLIDAGLAVTVWNRTPAVAEALAKTGGKIAATPQAAARGAEVVFTMVYDDDASRSVWLDPDDGALVGMSAGALGIECSTLSPAHVTRLHKAAAAHGVAFLDAPLAGSRPQAEAGQLIFMVGGALADVTRAEPLLLAMGSAVHRAGEAGAGSVVKLMVNTLFGSQLATLAELLGLAARTGVDPARAFEVLASTPVASPAVKAAGAAMLARNFAPAAPIDLIAKDLDLVARLGADLCQAMPMADASGTVFHAASVKGFGGDNVTGLVQVYIDAPPRETA